MKESTFMKTSFLKKKMVNAVVSTHIALYRLLKGWGILGRNVILITTIGRKSGLPRTRALVSIKDGKRFVIIASFGGSPQHPDWYVNLKANPHVTVEDRGHVIPTIASDITDEGEYAHLWSQMAALYPPYNDYQRRTTRKIPVVCLTPMQ